MNDLRTHLQTENYLNIRKAYLDGVVLPAFLKVAKSVVPIEKHYQIAGKHICIRFYGKSLADGLTVALSHNETAAGPADLTINAFDSVSTGVSFAPPWNDAKYLFKQTADAKNVLDEGFMGIFMPGEEALRLYDTKKSIAYFWTNDARKLPGWVEAAPMRALLHWFLSREGVHLFHGAVVALGESAVLLAAKGGSGKSTTALSCLLAGMDYLADDYVAVEIAQTVTAHSLYNSVKVASIRSPQFRSLQRHVWKEENGKSIIFLASLFPERIKMSVPLKAIFIPRISYAEKTNIVPAGKMEAMIAVVPTVLFQLPLAKTDMLENIKKIISKTPCYFLELGVDSSEAAEVIGKFLT